MERRHFLALTGLTLTAVAHQWLFDPARVAASLMGKRVDHAVVADLERVAEARRRMDDALGGGTLLPAVREDLRLVVAMLKNAAYSEEVGKRLHAVAAEYGRLAGWLADDCNQPALSQRYFTASEAAATIRRLDSPREKRLLVAFRRAAAPYATSAAVREFDAKHRDLLSLSLT